jgi:hypothetical protein
MKRSAEVDRWFKDRNPPAESALLRVREVILGADPRVTESVEYGTVMFAYEGDMATFVQYNKPRVNIMFNRGARIPGKYPRLEGSGPTARFMRFKDAAEVEARAKELAAVVAAWCVLPASAAGKKKGTVKTRGGR